MRAENPSSHKYNVAKRIPICSDFVN